MVELAKRFDDGPVQLSVVAKVQDLPLKYLEQLVIPLKRVGLVKGVRGVKGGHMLARPPGKITVWDVVVAMEEGPVAPCAADPAACARYFRCETRGIWQRIDRMISEELKSITLSRLVEDGTEGG